MLTGLQKTLCLTLFSLLCSTLLFSSVSAQGAINLQQECATQREYAYQQCLLQAQEVSVSANGGISEATPAMQGDCALQVEDNYQTCLKDIDPKNQKEQLFPPQTRTAIKGLNKLQANSVQDFLGQAIKTATGIMGTIALAMMIYGGFLWMTSSGNGSQVEKAQKVIFWGALGIFVIFGSYALVTFIFEAVNPVNTTAEQSE